MGIAIMLAGTGIAFSFGKPYVQPSATLLPGIPLGFWSDNAQVRNALSVCPLFLLGIVAAIATRVELQRHPGRAARPNRRRQSGRGAGAWAPDRSHALPRHRLRQRAGWNRRRIPVALLPRKLERGIVIRPRIDGGGAGCFLALEPGQLHLCLAAVRRGGRAGTVAADGGDYLGLLPVLRGALHRDAGCFDHHRPRRPVLARHAGQLSIGR